MKDEEIKKKNLEHQSFNTIFTQRQNNLIFKLRTFSKDSSKVDNEEIFNALHR